MVLLRVHLPKATVSKSALCWVPVRTCTLPTKMQHSHSWSSCLSLPTFQNWDFLCSSGSTHHREQQAGAQAAVAAVSLIRVGGHSGRFLLPVFSVETRSLHMGRIFVSEINSNITHCPFLDSGIKDVAHQQLCLLAKLPV